MTAARARSFRDLRLLPVAAAAWAAALMAVLAPATAGIVSGAAWIGAVGAIVLARRGIRAARPSARLRLVRVASPGVVALLAVACAVAGATAAHVAFAHPSRAAVAEGALVALDSGDGIEVEVTTKVERTAAGLRFTGTARTARGHAPISVLWRDGVPSHDLDLGAIVAVTGDGQRVDGESAVALVFADDVQVRAPPGGLAAVASDLRRGFARDVVAGLPDPGAGLLPGLAVGETGAVSPELDRAMKASSLSHLTAVSGSNCALVVGIAFGLAAVCGAGRRTRVVVALTVLGGFVLLVTPEASVVRAAAMAAVAMIALLLGRRGAGVAVLSLAVTVLLVADPWLATSFGFLLSAAATAALLLLAEPLARGLAGGMPRAMALGVAVPLAAQLVCGPIIVLFAPTVALYGVAANMIAGPAAPAATVLGLLACVCQAIPPLAAGFATLAWLPAAWVARTAHTFAGLPSAQVAWREGWMGCALLAALGVVVVVAITGLPARRAPPGGRESPAARRLAPASAHRTNLAAGRWRSRIVGWRAALRAAAVGILAIVTGMGAGAIALSGVAAPLTAPDDWSIALCDVGQGDAIVLRSRDAVALVDAGPDADALARCLRRLEVDRIDIAFLTHFDADHVTGVPAVAGRVATILHGPAEDPADLGPAERASEDVRAGYAGMSGRLGDATWRVLWPARNTRAFPPGNDTSLVVEIAGPDLPRTLLLGDLGADAQRMLLGSGAIRGEFAVVKVSHHGSRDQDPALYRRVRARVALIGVGENDYGHPHPETIAVLGSAGATIGRSDTDGLVLVSGGPLAVWREDG